MILLTKITPDEFENIVSGKVDYLVDRYGELLVCDVGDAIAIDAYSDETGYTGDYCLVRVKHFETVELNEEEYKPSVDIYSIQMLWCSKEI